MHEKGEYPFLHEGAPFTRKGRTMALTVNITYTGAPGAARAFANEMIAAGVVAGIRAEEGNLRYEYYQPLDDPDSIMLVDSWRNQAALDAHHASPWMARIAELRDRYDLHMRVERYVSAEDNAQDVAFIRQ